MEKERAKEQVIQAAIECSDKKLIHGTSGNVSIACREGGGHGDYTQRDTI